ncbi:hypothetical protein [Celeribacter indicus]|uniref:Uncharacterized protein n=1 Tax=Celeribacter indicus TaxID=1208324 RepID=A0A0B5DUW0_9RHOB|nr:hypothetical protein [Celeribacter indicus]AJE47183.1 hypothetical protein P73_2468 [Celeribacter indicus]SDW00226.1 hypothetical protein SAMN05443573_10116 [Celeribacter indicus]
MIYATNGAKIYIGAAVEVLGEDVVESDFASQPWVEIGEASSIGTLGDTASEITFEGLSHSRTRRLKGTRDGGTMELAFGLDAADTGQIALKAAEKTKDNYAFRVVMNDAPAGGGTPSERLFAAMVSSATEVLDETNSVMMLNSSLWVNSNIVRIDAAESGS